MVNLILAYVGFLMCGFAGENLDNKFYFFIGTIGIVIFFVFLSTFLFDFFKILFLEGYIK